MRYIYWILYLPKICGKGRLHYSRVEDETDEQYELADALSHFEDCKVSFVDTPEGSFVRFVLHDDGYSDDGDDNDVYYGSAKLKWRAYRDYTKCQDDDDDMFHCGLVEESKAVFTNYEECVKDFEKNCAYKKKYPNRSILMYAEFFESDKNF